MPKMKTCKAITKRIKITPRGKIIYAKPGRRHLLSTKTSKRKRHLRKAGIVTGKMTKIINQGVPY